MDFIGPAKAVGYAGTYWQSGVLCTSGLAVPRVLYSTVLRFGKAVYCGFRN